MNKNKKLLIGFGTGDLHKLNIDNVDNKTIEMFAELGTGAIEVHSRIELIDRLENLNPTSFKGIKYISLHAPSGIIYQSKNGKQVLDKIYKSWQKIGYQAIVFHPDTIQDWPLLASYKMPIAIENSDNRKKFGQTVKDLKQIFAKYPDFKMVLDINHCYVNDKSLKLAQDFYKNFKSIICHLHISGFVTFHDPIYKNKQNFILKAVPNPALPMIIESVFSNLKEPQKEIDYVKNFFAN